MLLTFILRSVPPRLIEFIFYWVLPIALSIRLLISTKKGFLVLVVALYFYCLYFSDSPPYSFSELILWFDSLDKDFKTGVATSLLTIFGFLLTYHVASTSWKTETLAKLRLEAASEIEKFFNEAAVLCVDLDIYARSVVVAVKEYKEKGLTRDTYFRVHQVAKNLDAAFIARDRLTVMSIESNHLFARHAAVISGVPSAVSLLSDAITSFTEIESKRWLHVPKSPDLKEDEVEIFVSFIGLKTCIDYTEAYEENYSRMTSLAGGLRGLLMQTVVDFNFSMIWEKRDEFSIKEGIEALRGKAR